MTFGFTAASVMFKSKPNCGCVHVDNKESTRSWLGLKTLYNDENINQNTTPRVTHLWQTHFGTCLSGLP